VTVPLDPAAIYAGVLLTADPDGLVAEMTTDNNSTFIPASNVTSIGRAKKLLGGTHVSLSGKVVTAAFPEASYIEEADRSAGIRVQTDTNLAEGDRIAVSGQVTTLNREKLLVADLVTVQANGEKLPPSLGFVGRSLGGSSMEDVGLSIGLLMRLWGAVIQVGEGYLYIDDGSGLRDGTSTGAEENVGVRVICDPAGYSSGEKVEVTGISSCFWTPSGTARRILTCKPEDLRKLTGP
jgi:hypothetical protein